MALIKCKIKSDILKTCVDINIYMPCDLGEGQPSNVPKATITLLHGYTDDYGSWFSWTAAERYAADNSTVLICPSAQNSFYQDSAFGAYKTFITEEMPEYLSRMFVFPKERERNFIAGLSMGGYGALHLGLSRPDIYAGCASFSGALDLQKFAENMKGEMEPMGKLMFNLQNGKLPDDRNLFKLIEKVSKMDKKDQPKILMTCGNEDFAPFFITPQNDSFYNHAKDLNLANFKRMQWSGNHEWKVWDRSLVYAFDYFINEGYAAQKHADWTCEPTIMK